MTDICRWGSAVFSKMKGGGYQGNTLYDREPYYINARAGQVLVSTETISKI